MNTEARFQATEPFEDAPVRINAQETVIRDLYDDRMYLLPTHESRTRIADQWSRTYARYTKWSTAESLRSIGTMLLLITLFMIAQMSIYTAVGISRFEVNQVTLGVITASAVVIYTALRLLLRRFTPRKKDTYLTIAGSAEVTIESINPHATERITDRQRAVLFSAAADPAVFSRALQTVIRDHDNDLIAEQKVKDRNLEQQVQALLEPENHR